MDVSIKEAVDSNWKTIARGKSKKSDVVIFICGTHTDQASGVSAEMTITQEEEKEYFLLKGRPDEIVKKPKGFLSNDNIYKWTWENLRFLIKGKK